RWLADLSNLGKLYLDRYVVATSSGTTSTYGIVAHDLAGLDRFNAIVYARPAVRPERLLSPREQFLATLQLLFVEKGRVGLILMAGTPLPSYTISLFTPGIIRALNTLRTFSTIEPLPRLVEQLNEFQPQGLLSYSTMLGVLAREQLAGRL